MHILLSLYLNDRAELIQLMRGLVSEHFGVSFFSTLAQFNRSPHCSKLGHFSGLLSLLPCLGNDLVSMLLGKEDILLELKSFCSGDLLALENIIIT